MYGVVGHSIEHTERKKRKPTKCHSKSNSTKPKSSIRAGVIIGGAVLGCRIPKNEDRFLKREDTTDVRCSKYDDSTYNTASNSNSNLYENISKTVEDETYLHNNECVKNSYISDTGHQYLERTGNVNSASKSEVAFRNIVHAKSPSKNVGWRGKFRKKRPQEIEKTESVVYSTTECGEGNVNIEGNCITSSDGLFRRYRNEIDYTEDTVPCNVDARVNNICDERLRTNCISDTRIPIEGSITDDDEWCETISNVYPCSSPELAHYRGYQEIIGFSHSPSPNSTQYYDTISGSSRKEMIDPLTTCDDLSIATCYERYSPSNFRIEPTYASDSTLKGSPSRSSRLEDVNYSNFGSSYKSEFPIRSLQEKSKSNLEDLWSTTKSRELDGTNLIKPSLSLSENLKDVPISVVRGNRRELINYKEKESPSSRRSRCRVKCLSKSKSETLLSHLEKHARQCSEKRRKENSRKLKSNSETSRSNDRRYRVSRSQEDICSSSGKLTKSEEVRGSSQGSINNCTNSKVENKCDSARSICNVGSVHKERGNSTATSVQDEKKETPREAAKRRRERERRRREAALPFLQRIYVMMKRLSGTEEEGMPIFLYL